MHPDHTQVKKQFTLSKNDIHYPGQTNHDACFIPESVRQYYGEPLYILVAYWCQQQNDWVHRNQIAEAFHIPARRASHLVSYLRNKAVRVDCEYRESESANRISRYEIRVTAVRICPPRKKNLLSRAPRITRRKVGPTDTREANELWKQLCQHRRAGLLINKKGDDSE